MKKLLFMSAVGLGIILLGWLLPVTQQVQAGRQFTTNYGWLDDAESTSLVQDTIGLATQAGAKIGLISWQIDYSTLVVAFKATYDATPVADTCTGMWDNLGTDTIGVDVWTGDDQYDFRKKVWTHKYVMDSTWDVFTIPAESSLASNTWFVLRSWIKDSSLACAVTGTNKGIRYDATVKAWGK